MKLGSRAAALAFCAALLLTPASPAQAKTYKVTTTKDKDGTKCKKTCSIRQALNASAAKSGKDTVKVPQGTYKLKRGELTLGSEVGLKGAGATKTIINANGKSRVMTVSGGPVTISKVMITGGNAKLGDMSAFPGDGGGIVAQAAEALTLKDVAIVGNQAEMSGGGLASPIENMTSTEIKISGSTFAQNQVSGGMADGSGGGMLVAGDLTLINSTIANNSIENMAMTNRGGGLSLMPNPDADGGSGMTNVKLTNSTIANNSIGGDAMGGMGGGLGLGDPMMGGMVNITALNTIIAQNKVLGSIEDCGMLAMGLSSKSNLSSDQTCMFDDGKSIEDTNPKLGKLLLNGGQTQTLLPKSSSPVIDKGSDVGCPSRDQRHVKRPVGKHCDIGAVER